MLNKIDIPGTSITLEIVDKTITITKWSDGTTWTIPIWTLHS